jgi:ABC-type sugar transport system substrate-binding protein
MRPIAGGAATDRPTTGSARQDCAYDRGIDALPGLDGGRQAVADGKLDATFVYPTGGRQAVELAARILKDEKVPHRVVLPTEKITRQ